MKQNSSERTSKRILLENMERKADNENENKKEGLKSFKKKKEITGAYP